MAVISMYTVQNFIGKSQDDKPENPPAGSTFHEWNTGETKVYDGTNWQDDLRLIYAIGQGLRS